MPAQKHSPSPVADCELMTMTTASPVNDDRHHNHELGSLLVQAIGPAPQSCLLIIHFNFENSRQRVSVTRSSGEGRSASRRNVDGRNLIETLRTLVGNEERRTCPKCERELPLKSFNRNGYCLGCEVERARANRQARREALAAGRRREH